MITHILRRVMPNGIVVYQCGEVSSDTLAMATSPVVATCHECTCRVARELRPTTRHAAFSIVEGVA